MFWHQRFRRFGLYVCLLQALECQAGFSDSNNGQDVTITQQQWLDFLGAFSDRLKLLRLIANVSRCSSPAYCH